MQEDVTAALADRTPLNLIVREWVRAWWLCDVVNNFLLCSGQSCWHSIATCVCVCVCVCVLDVYVLVFLWSGALVFVLNDVHSICTG